VAAKDDLGRRGEELAARYLADAGYTILERNWRCARGEIDIVARSGGELVFVEVKTRAGLAYGHPFEAITARKLSRMRRLAGEWCAAHPDERGLVRVDAIAVLAPPDCPYRIEHLSGVS
jgi:putative endonuclease